MFHVRNIMGFRVLCGIAAIRTDEHHTRTIESTIRDICHFLRNHKVEALRHTCEGFFLNTGE